MMEFGWASGFVKPGVCHIRTVYPGGERSTYFEGTRVFVAICGAWLGPEPDVVTEDDLPRCAACELSVRPLPTFD
jgi:hypothetical protein